MACFLTEAFGQANDNFAGRLALSGATAAAVSNNLQATRETGEPNHAANAAGRSLWWTWTAPATGTVNFSTFNGGSGNAPARVLAVYSGNAPGALTEIASSNNLPYSSGAGSVAQAVALAATGASVNVPVTAGTVYQIAVDAARVPTASDDGTVVLAVNAAPTVVSAATVNATTGASFQYNVLASNGATVYAATTLPTGLSVNPASGVISGTPTVSGNYTVELSATGPGGTGTATLTIQVADPVAASPGAPVITDAAGARAVVGKAFTYHLYATGSPTAYAASNLPPGLSADAATGTVSGTPTAAGTFAVPLTSWARRATTSAVVTIIIKAGPVGVPTFGIAASFDDEAVLTEFDNSVNASNNPSSYAASGLPPGVTLNTAYGHLGGTPTTHGTYKSTFSATNRAGTGTATVTFNIEPPTPLRITSPAAAYGTVGSAFSYSLTANFYFTSCTVSDLPPGLGVNTSTCVISGTPTVAGVYAVPVTGYSDYGTYGNYGTGKGTLTITIAPAVLGVPVVNSYAEATGSVGNSFSYTVASTPAAASYAVGGLPPGLTFNSAYRLISGTPTAAGVYTVPLSATNASGTGNATLTLVIAPLSASVLSGSAVVNATVGTSFNYGITASGAPASYAASGLPAGVTLNAATGAISGAPTAAGTYTVPVSATNSAGTGTATLTINAVAGTSSAPTFSTSTPLIYSLTTTISTTLSLYTTNSPTSFTASGLPADWNINASYGYINITGSGLITAGTYPVTVTSTNAYGSASAVITFIVTNAAATPPSFTSLAATTLGYAGVPFGNGFFSILPAGNYTITALNGPTSFGASNLPPGVSLNPYTGALSGQPGVSGIFQVPISATNTAGTCNATLTIIGTVSFPALVAPLAASGSVGAAFSSVVQVSGIQIFGLANYEQSQKLYDPVTFGAAGLPPGLSMDTATGYITGTPSRAGTYPVTITATNRAGTGRGVMTIIIAATPPAPTAPPVLSGRAVAPGFVGLPLSYALTATNAPSYTATGLPTGCNLNAATGQITGTPQAAGTFAVPVTATNNLGTVQGTLTVVIAAAPTAPFINSVAQTNATVGTPFVYIVYAGNYSGMPAAASYGAGDLPTGLRFDPKTGAISGTPTGPAGTYQVPISALTGGIAGSATLTLVVQAAAASPGPPALTAPAGTLGFVGNPFTYKVSMAFHPTDALPGGLGFDAVTGEITGLPSNAGSNKIAFAADPANGTNASASGGSAILMLTIVTPDLSLPFITAQRGGGTILQNEDFSFTAAAVGAPAPGYQWTHDGVLIAGATAGTLTLTQAQPADAGVYTVTAANTAGRTVSAPVVLVIHQTYATWQATRFTRAEIAAGQGALEFDSNGDGVVNLLKYALGIDPGTGAGGSLPVSSYSTADHTLQLLFTRDTAKIDVSYVVEASSNLSQWTPIASSTAGASTISLGGSLTIVEAALYGTSRVNVVVKNSQSSVATVRQFFALTSGSALRIGDANPRKKPLLVIVPAGNRTRIEGLGNLYSIR